MSERRTSLRQRLNGFEQADRYIRWVEHGRSRYAPACRDCGWMGPPTNTKQVAYDEGTAHACTTDQPTQTGATDE